MTPRWIGLTLFAATLSLLACETPPVTTTRPRIAGNPPKSPTSKAPSAGPSAQASAPSASRAPVVVPSQEPPPVPVRPPTLTGGGGTGAAPSPAGSPVLGLVAGAQPKNTWLAGVPLQRPRAGLVAAALGDRLHVLEGANSPSRETYGAGELAWMLDDHYDMAHATDLTKALRHGRSLMTLGIASNALVTAGGANGIGLLNTIVRYGADGPAGETVLLANELKAASGGLSGDILVVAGGLKRDGTLSNVTHRLNMNTTTQSAGAAMPLAVAGAAGVAVGTKIYVFGGYTLAAGVATPQTAMQVYDVTADTWRRDGDTGATPPAPLPEARHSAAAAVLDGKIYLAGGLGAAGTPLGTIAVYDPGTNAWTTLAAMRTPRALLALAAYQGRLWAIGGFDASNRALSSVEIYQP